MTLVDLRKVNRKYKKVIEKFFLLTQQLSKIDKCQITLDMTIGITFERCLTSSSTVAKVYIRNSEKTCYEYSTSLLCQLLVRKYFSYHRTSFLSCRHSSILSGQQTITQLFLLVSRWAHERTAGGSARMSFQMMCRTRRKGTQSLFLQFATLAERRPQPQFLK